MGKELTVVNAAAIPAITFSPDSMKVDKLKADYPVDKIPTDLSIKENYELVCAGCKAHQKGRTGIEKTHKELKKPYWDTGKQLDGAKKEMLDDLAPIENAWQTAKKGQDDIEKKRLAEEARIEQEAIDKITTKIAWINGYSARLIGKPSTDVSEAIEQLNGEKFEWAGAMVESAKNTVGSVLVHLTNLHKMKVENENSERLAEEERVKRKEEESKRAKELAIEQKRVAGERAEMEAEKEKIQAEKDELQAAKDKIEREKLEAEEEVKRLQAEKIAEQERVAAEKKAELERIETEKKDAKLKEEQDALAEKESIKTAKEEKALVKKLAKEVEKRKQETIGSIIKILQNDKAYYDLASEIVDKSQDGLIPNLTFC